MIGAPFWPGSGGSLGRVAARGRQRGGLRSEERRSVALHLEHLGCILQLPGKLLEALPEVCEGLHATTSSDMLLGCTKEPAACVLCALRTQAP